MSTPAEQNRKVWIGFDLGGTKMLAAVYDNDFSVSWERNAAGLAKKAAAVFLSIESLNRFTWHCRMRKSMSKSIGAIGAGCPGPVDMDRGIILESPNLGWKNLPLRDQLADAFQCPVAGL